jgi:hypothetical protein
MIEVQLHHQLSAIDAAAIEALNLRSRRASPFLGPAWLEAFVAGDRGYLDERPCLWLLSALEGGRTIGFLPLKLTESRFGRKLSWVSTVEIERPQTVALPEDEKRVAEAFSGLLLDRWTEWDLLELSQQDPTSALYQSPPGLRRHWFRRLPDRQNNIVPLRYPDMKALVAAMSNKMRWNLKKQLSGLLTRDGLEVLVGAEPAAREPLFQLLKDVEARSWKLRGDATMASREGTYRTVMADERAPFRLFVYVVMLDGAPIAGGIWGEYGENSYFLQSAYAEEHTELSPGTLVAWIALEAALRAGRKEFNMLPDFSYYKTRWLAEVTETETVQVFRYGSRYQLKAALGDFRRKVLPPPSAKAPPSNPYRDAAGRAREIPQVDLTRAATLAAAAKAAGARVVTSAELCLRSPFAAKARASVA